MNNESRNQTSSIVYLFLAAASIVSLSNLPRADSFGSAFTPPPPPRVVVRSASVRMLQTNGEKEKFLSSLDKIDAFNAATQRRTQLMNSMIPSNPTPKPGSVGSFEEIAPGTWKIVYAPHISAFSRLAGGKFDPVLYEMNRDGTIVSHAKYDFPLLGEGWLSVGGTYGSEDQDVKSRVDFDSAWIVPGGGEPVRSFEKAPREWYKDLVNSLGRGGFRKEFAVFPVSYLDEDTIVFDFELFGTRICARRVATSS